MSRMRFRNKEFPAKRDEMFIWEKTSHQIGIPGL